MKRSMETFVESILKPAMTAVHGDADVVTRTICEVDGLEPVLASEARDIAVELTGANSTDVVAFGTKAGLFQRAGISAIICGPGSIEQAHKADDFLSLEQLDICLTMLSKLGAKLI